MIVSIWLRLMGVKAIILCVRQPSMLHLRYDVHESSSSSSSSMRIVVADHPVHSVRHHPHPAVSKEGVVVEKMFQDLVNISSVSHYYRRHQTHPLPVIQTTKSCRTQHSYRLHNLVDDNRCTNRVPLNVVNVDVQILRLFDSNRDYQPEDRETDRPILEKDTHSTHTQ